MELFEQAIYALLRGEFICLARHRDLYDFLANARNFEEVDEYLWKINRKVMATRSREAFYAAFIRMGEGERAEVKRAFAEVKRDIRPVVHFLQLVMQATGTEEVLTAGDRVDFGSLLKAIVDSEHLTEELRQLTMTLRELGARDTQVKAMLDRVLRYLVGRGYLHMLDGDKQVYAVAGKIDYFHEVLEFLIENEPPIQATAEEETPAVVAPNGDLFAS